MSKDYLAVVEKGRPFKDQNSFDNAYNGICNKWGCDHDSVTKWLNNHIEKGNVKKALSEQPQVNPQVQKQAVAPKLTPSSGANPIS